MTDYRLWLAAFSVIIFVATIVNYLRTDWEEGDEEDTHLH